MRPPVAAEPGAKPKAKKKSLAYESDEDVKPKRKYVRKAPLTSPQPVGGGFMGMMVAPNDDVGERRIKAASQVLELGGGNSPWGP